MSKKNIYRGIAELVGNTPLVELVNIEEQLGLKARILAKMESLNPAGSAKDRVAKEMIEQAEADGRLKKGGTIIEPTSGNTGIGLASMATVKGYRAIIVLPDTMSVERINIMKAYGAEVVLSDGKLGMKGGTTFFQKVSQWVNTTASPKQPQSETGLSKANQNVSGVITAIRANTARGAMILRMPKNK